MYLLLCIITCQDAWEQVAPKHKAWECLRFLRPSTGVYTWNKCCILWLIIHKIINLYLLSSFFINMKAVFQNKKGLNGSSCHNGCFLHPWSWSTASKWTVPGLIAAHTGHERFSFQILETREGKHSVTKFDNIHALNEALVQKKLWMWPLSKSMRKQVSLCQMKLQLNIPLSFLNRIMIVNRS